MLLKLVYQVGQKRGRVSIAVDEDEETKKKVRIGMRARQWITVFSARRPMKQRFVYILVPDICWCFISWCN